MNALDNEIRALKYDENELLARKELGTSSFIPAETREEGNKYIVVKRSEKTMESENYEIGIVESVIDRTFPGSLLKINKNLTDNNPDILVAERKPMRFRVDIPGMGSDAEFTIDNPDNISVATGIDNVLKKYSGQTLPTRVTFKGTMAYSENQLNAAFGLEMKHVGKQLGINFNAVLEKKSSVYVTSFRQIFYTVASERPKNPSDVFADSETWDLLKSKGVDNQNPPGLVNLVGYGRSVYVKMETSEQSNFVEAAFKASINENLEITADAKYKDVLKNSSFTAVILGGGTKNHIEVIKCKTIEEVKEILVNNSEYGKDNPGYPIFYNTMFLKDNKNAKTVDAVKYIETTSEVYESGLIKLKHTGAYVAKFKVKWEEITYDASGKKIITTKCWEKNDKDLTAGFSTEIPLKGNCQNISIKAEGCTGLAWEWWRTSFDRKGISLSPTISLHISGTTLNQKYDFKA